ncbi:MAG: MBL fold metallo-hydrolase [Gemmatimonadota bacterium]|nr:MBL fold metallo-hydrolase [Gemmatimonadota bacterium]MDH5760264.1 MBL fold metallo-hydrolase [Gemmatimonadota bacterium]
MRLAVFRLRTRRAGITTALAVGGFCALATLPLRARQSVPRTRVVMLGTGTPNADPERSGPAVAVVVDDRAYLVDAGAGVVRRAAQAARDLGIAALEPDRLNRVFLTHLHSDHTVGIPDLLLTPWVLDRPDPLTLHGPVGTGRMLDLIVQAWSDDIAVRRDGLEPRDHNRDAYLPVVEEVLEGLVFEDDLVRVYAIPVVHGSWERAFAYRFEGPDRTVVISGDTGPGDVLARACSGCDVLVHEVYSVDAFVTRPPEWQAYHRRFHTSTTELAEIASRAAPGTLVMYHQLFWGRGDEDLIRELRRAGYGGPAVSAVDLGVY